MIAEPLGKMPTTRILRYSCEDDWVKIQMPVRFKIGYISIKVDSMEA